MRRWVAPVAWALLILCLTSLPGSSLALVPEFPLADKIAHAVMYGVLGALATRSVTRGGMRGGAMTLTLMVIAVFALADEWHQQFIPGRGMDPADWMADVFGASTCATLVRRSLRNREQTP